MLSRSNLFKFGFLIALIEAIDDQSVILKMIKKSEISF